ncbi:sigma-70 family RNA polymerase sigma factor [Paraglaciecola sp.]|uniref:RNA polymerase sigma factor n=1 Tax=Paraglaciecola sp. TaxID=1920173 RepID=UPI0030F38225
MFFSQLYKNYWPELRTKLYARFGSGPPDPEDIAQQAFIKYSECVTDSPIKNPKAFIYTIARNLFIDAYRQQNKQQQIIDGIFDDVGIAPLVEISPEQCALDKEQNHLIQKAISRLSEKQKKLILASSVDGKSYRHIAAEMGYSLSDVSRSIALAHQFIQSEIQKVDTEAEKTFDTSVQLNYRDSL